VYILDAKWPKNDYSFIPFLIYAYSTTGIITIMCLIGRQCLPERSLFCVFY
jgi:hypothetical protein